MLPYDTYGWTEYILIKLKQSHLCSIAIRGGSIERHQPMEPWNISKSEVKEHGLIGIIQSIFEKESLNTGSELIGS